MNQLQKPLLQTRLFRLFFEHKRKRKERKKKNKERECFVLQIQEEALEARSGL